MKKVHIEYLKNMVANIAFNGEPLFSSGRFLETYPKLDTFQSLIPLCVISSIKNNKTDNALELENRLKKRNPIEPIHDNEGNKYLRYIIESFKQEYSYTLHFVLNDPTRDILSNLDTPGILDQCKRYVSNLPSIYDRVSIPVDAVTTEPIKYKIHIDVMSEELISDFASDGLYILSINIVFKDKLLALTEEPVFLPTSIKIIPPVRVEINN